MRLCTLASGSSGNSLFVETRGARVLIDAGISPRQLKSRLETIGVDMSEIDCILVTHEHTDHVAALKYVDIPVYIASPTVHLWKDEVKIIREFDSGRPFFIKDMCVIPFSIPHDGIEPVGFRLETEGIKIGVVTDIGCVTNLVRERLSGLDALLLEFNHDEDMLIAGPYPWDLKQRIKGRLGHLSNREAAELLGYVIHEGLKCVVLAHLSEVNNTPELAQEAALSTLMGREHNHIRLSIAPQRRLGEVIEL